MLRARPQYDHIILVVQGRGALGAYQAGISEWMREAGYLPDWITGVGCPERLRRRSAAAIPLGRLIIFDRVRRREVRLSVGAVNVRTGN